MFGSNLYWKATDNWTAKPSSVLEFRDEPCAPLSSENSILGKVLGKVMNLFQGQIQYLPPS